MMNDNPYQDDDHDNMEYEPDEEWVPHEETCSGCMKCYGMTWSDFFY